MKKILSIVVLLAMVISITSCDEAGKKAKDKKKEKQEPQTEIQKKLAQYKKVKLTADISHLSDNEKKMLVKLYEACAIMDDIFWMQNIGQKEEFLRQFKEDKDLFNYARINYGPWDELDNLAPFVDGVGPKPKGANFYPHDMTEEEFEAFDDPNKTNLYTLIQRDENGALKSVWYHEAYKEEHEKAAYLLEEAAELAGDKEFAHYLKVRANALRTDDYYESDLAWLDVKNNNVDLVLGPIENYTDGLYGYKAAHEGFILIKDKEWSDKLTKFAAFLPQMQMDLPVDPEYKKDIPGSDADLNAYDVIYYAGDCNNGSKTIAINLPNDERVHVEKGTRKLQLKNAMKAKFEEILVPISDVLIAEEQRKHVTFDAFFGNTMFHEVAHGMGIKNTIDGSNTVRKALKEQYSAIEEGKADIFGLYLVTKLHEMGELGDADLMDNYVTFMAGIFRSVRFGASSAHGKANMMRFNYFLEQEAFNRAEDGTYAIDFAKMQDASTALMKEILKVQGNGDYEAAKAWVAKDGVIPEVLQADLDRLADEGIPVDIVFRQGSHIMGLTERAKRN